MTLMFPCNGHCSRVVEECIIQLVVVCPPQTYQRQLLAYQRRVDPDLAVMHSKDFVDLRTEDLTSAEVNTNNFEGQEYQNGIRVVAGGTDLLLLLFMIITFAVLAYM